MSNSAHTVAAAWTRARLVFASVAMSVCVIAVPAPARASDPVMDWNDIARQLIVVPAFAPVEQTRAMAIVQIAVHDAINAISGEYERYYPVGSAPAGASPEAAAIASAYQALTGVVGASTFLTDSYGASLVTHNISALDPGLAFGQSVANRIQVLRKSSTRAFIRAFTSAPLTRWAQSSAGRWRGSW
jgi:hypothetical protein